MIRTFERAAAQMFLFLMVFLLMQKNRKLYFVSDSISIPEIEAQDPRNIN